MVFFISLQKHHVSVPKTTSEPLSEEEEEEAEDPFNYKPLAKIRRTTPIATPITYDPNIVLFNKNFFSNKLTEQGITQLLRRGKG